MKRIMFAVLVIVSLSSISLAKYSGGSGQSGDPYQIANVADLLALAADANDYNKCFIMTADINLDPCLPGNHIFTGTIIAPSDVNGFAGIFDGAGHKILRLTINTGGERNDSLGLFGYNVGEINNLGIEDINITTEESYSGGGLTGWNNGNIKNCYSDGNILAGYMSGFGGLSGGNSGNIINYHSTVAVTGGDSSGFLGGLVGENFGNITCCYSESNVTGGNYLGGLVGKNWGTSINNCYSTGDVNGYDTVGGLIGDNSFSGDTKNCYSTGNVNGYYAVGGLVGNNLASIYNCYSTGDVNGYGSVGGLIGYDNHSGLLGYDSQIIINGWGGIISGCYFLEGAGPDNGYGEPLTKEQMKEQPSFVGWDFVGETVNGLNEIWTINDGIDYPKLVWTTRYSGGFGKSGNPYYIVTHEDLNDIGNHPEDFNKYFLILRDIDMSSIAANEYRIIGSEANKFTGVFDGGNHVISNFKSNCSLFGSVYGDTSAIKNLGLIDVNCQGAALVRDFQGMNTGTIFNCFVKGGIVTGSSAAGLINGGSGIISNCYTTCDVISTDAHAAGIVCFWTGSTISYCHSSGNITATGSEGHCGGIVGENWGGRIYRCYSTGNINSNLFHTGGVVALAIGATVEECWSTGYITDTNPDGSTGGLVGMSDTWGGNSLIKNCYSRSMVSGGAGLIGTLWAFGGSATLENCYSTGLVSGGGLVGEVLQDYDGVVSCTSSYWDVNASNQSWSACGTGKTTAEMKTQSTYTGWNFPGIWRIHQSVDYPKLLWAKGRLAGLYEVEFDDVKAMAGWWLRNDCDSNNACDNADIDFSGGIDFVDFALIAQNWLQGY